MKPCALHIARMASNACTATLVRVKTLSTTLQIYVHLYLVEGGKHSIRHMCSAILRDFLSSQDHNLDDSFFGGARPRRRQIAYNTIQYNTQIYFPLLFVLLVGWYGVVGNPS